MARGEQARTRPYFDRNPDRPYFTSTARGAKAPDVYLSEHLLRAILYINDEFGSMTINAIAGLNHFGGRDDEHIRGMAIDMNRIPNVPSGDVLGFLEGEGFVTQRTREQHLPHLASATPHTYINFGDNSLHLAIYGRI